MKKSKKTFVVSIIKFILLFAIANTSYAYEATYYLDLAKEYYENGEIDTAKDDVQKGLAVYPLNSDLLALKAMIDDAIAKRQKARDDEQKEASKKANLEKAKSEHRVKEEQKKMTKLASEKPQQKKGNGFRACWCGNSAARDCSKVTLSKCWSISAKDYTQMAYDPNKRDCVYDDKTVCVDPSAGYLRGD